MNDCDFAECGNYPQGYLSEMLLRWTGYCWHTLCSESGMVQTAKMRSPPSLCLIPTLIHQAAYGLLHDKYHLPAVRLQAFRRREHHLIRNSLQSNRPRANASFLSAPFFMCSLLCFFISCNIISTKNKLASLYLLEFYICLLHCIIKITQA